MNDFDIETLATLAKALGHPARVKILLYLLKKKQCICGSIVNELDLAQSTVSQHLKIMKEAELVQGEVDGPRICYCLNPEKLRFFQSFIASLQPKETQET